MSNLFAPIGTKSPATGKTVVSQTSAGGGGISVVPVNAGSFVAAITPNANSTQITGSEISLVRPHTVATIALGTMQKEELENNKKILAELKTKSTAISTNSGRNIQDARRSNRKPVAAYKNKTSQMVAATMGKRNQNQSDKEETKKIILDLCKDAGTKTQLFIMIYEYGKIFNLDMSKNPAIVARGVERAFANGQDAKFHIERYESFLIDYEAFLGKFLTLCIQKGAQEKFLSWGVLAEDFKPEFEAAFKSMVNGFESLKFAYSKWLFYPLNIATAAHWNEKFITANIIPLIGVCESAGTALPLPDNLNNLNNAWAKEQLENLKLKFDSVDPNAIREAMKTTEFHKAVATDLYSSIIMAAGVSPYGVMQSHEYKQNLGSNEHIRATYSAVAMNFTRIMLGYNKIFGKKDNFKSFTNYKFATLQQEIYARWRPIFVYARVLRTLVFPQAQFAINSDIDMEDFFIEDNVNDEMFAKMFKITFSSIKQESA